MPPFPEREGGVVLNATISRYAYGTLVPRQDEQISIESVDFGMTTTYGIDESLTFDGKLDMVKAAIRSVQNRYPRRADDSADRRRFHWVRPLPALERAARHRARLVLRHGGDADRAAEGVPQPPALGL